MCRHCICRALAARAMVQRANAVEGRLVAPANNMDAAGAVQAMIDKSVLEASRFPNIGR